MNTHERLIAWIREMDYNDKNTLNLENICGPSTSFVWEQVISDIKPRKEVERIRKNLIVNRLRRKSLKYQDEFNYPIKEIEIYAKKQEMEKKIKYLENDINEREVKLNSLLNKNKLKYVAVDNLKQEIKESNERTYLLKKKSKKLEEDIHYVEEMITLAKNLTPVEMEENLDKEKITETLQKCADKLKKLSHDISLNNTSGTNMSRSSSLISLGMTKIPATSRTSNFGNSSEKKKRRTEGKSVNKENCFSDTKSVKWTSKKEQLANISENGKSTKRESLGLLPESCFNAHNELGDEFFLTITNSSRLSAKCLFSDHSYVTEKSTIYSESNSLLPESLLSCYESNCSISDKLCGDKFVCETLKKFLYAYNRQLILKKCQDINENLLSDMRSLVFEYDKFESNPKIIGQDDITELYFIHIKNELEKSKYRVISKKLRETVKRYKDDIYFQLVNKSLTKNKAAEIKKILELQIEEVELDCVIKFLRTEINVAQKTESDTELQLILTKMKQINDKIVSRISCIGDYIANTYKIIQSIKDTSDETFSCVRRLNQFIADISWADLLNENLFFEESQVFEKFPIEYNRRCTKSGGKIPYRDICTSKCPTGISLDSNQLVMITILMDTPFSTTEDILFNILKLKMKLNILKFLPPSLKELNYPKYSLKELNSKESYVQSIVSELNFLISSSMKYIIPSPAVIKNIMELWTEMAFKDFISDKRLVEGHGYKFYEKKYDSVYKTS